MLYTSMCHQEVSSPTLVNEVVGGCAPRGPRGRWIVRSKGGDNDVTAGSEVRRLSPTGPRDGGATTTAGWVRYYGGLRG